MRATAQNSIEWWRSARRCRSCGASLRDLGLTAAAREGAGRGGETDATRVRIGNTEYARDNKSFDSRLAQSPRELHPGWSCGAEFRGKGGVQHEVHRRPAYRADRAALPGNPDSICFNTSAMMGSAVPSIPARSTSTREAMGDDFTAMTSAPGVRLCMPSPCWLARRCRNLRANAN